MTEMAVGSTNSPPTFSTVAEGHITICSSCSCSILSYNLKDIGLKPLNLSHTDTDMRVSNRKEKIDKVKLIYGIYQKLHSNLQLLFS